MGQRSTEDREPEGVGKDGDTTGTWGGWKRCSWKQRGSEAGQVQAGQPRMAEETEVDRQLEQHPQRQPAVGSVPPMGSTSCPQTHQELGAFSLDFSLMKRQTNLQRKDIKKFKKKKSLSVMKP